MCVSRQLAMTKYWLKILHENSLLFKTYKMLKRDVDANKTYNKTYHIKLLLDTCGLSYLWINQVNIRIHCNTIKSRILGIFKQSWYSNINNSNRLETYCLFKHEIIFESYPDQIRDSRFRICLTRLKLSSHDLAIVKGHHQNIASQERVRNNCTMSVLETEYHYLLICPKLYNLRTKYIKKIYIHGLPYTN